MDKTERFRGRLMAGDKIILDPLFGFLKSSKRSGAAMGEWTGHFDCPPEHREAFVAGNRYRLVLIDGRSGTVAVRLKEGEAVDPLVVDFHGTGSVRG